MNKLDLCPLQSSYSVNYGTSVERIALRGGFGRYVQTKDAKKHLVDVTFTLREDDFIYFRAFYLNWQLNPLPFLMSLIIEDSEFKEYIAQFRPDSFLFNELNGRVFNVSAQLVVITSNVRILSSKPYPIEHIDGLSTSFTIYPSVLQTVYKSSELNHEDVYTSFNVENPVRQDSVIYSSYTPEPESVQTEFLVLSSVQETLVINQDTDIESLTTQFTVLNPVRN